MKNTLMTG